MKIWNFSKFGLGVWVGKMISQIITKVFTADESVEMNRLGDSDFNWPREFFNKVNIPFVYKRVSRRNNLRIHRDFEKLKMDQFKCFDKNWKKTGTNNFEVSLRLICRLMKVTLIKAPQDVDILAVLDHWIPRSHSYHGRPRFRPWTMVFVLG